MHIRFDTYQQRTAEATSFAQETVLSLQFFYVMIANSREAKGELIMWEIIEEAVLELRKNSSVFVFVIPCGRIYRASDEPKDQRQ